MSDARRHEICAVALAECFRGDGEILASPMGNLPSLGARLARLTFEPDLLLSDGIASLMADTPALGAKPSVIEGWIPYRTVFDVVWSGRRHVIMGASQLDRFGNQNISVVGSWAKPKAQLIGSRGAPGNTINHTTSYWVPNHSPKVFVSKVDFASGVGFDRALALHPASRRFHCIRRVVSNLCVLDFETEDHSARLVSVHPGVSVEEVRAATGFELGTAGTVPETRLPSAEELALLRERLDPRGLGAREIAG